MRDNYEIYTIVYINLFYKLQGCNVYNFTTYISRDKIDILYLDIILAKLHHLSNKTPRSS